MSISTALRRRLAVALASADAAKAIADAIEASNTPVANIGAIGTTANLSPSATAGGATPTAAQVDDAIDALAANVEARLDAIEAKVDTLLTALKQSGVMIDD